MTAPSEERAAVVRPEPRIVAGGCEYGCGYAGPCPGKRDCVHWDRGQWIGPTRYAIERGEHIRKDEGHE